MHELPSAPDPASVARIRSVVVAGHRGDAATALAHLGDQSDLVREAALAALDRAGGLDEGHLRAGAADPAPRVRARAATLAIDRSAQVIVGLLADDDGSVVEVAAFAAGEHRWLGDAPVVELGRIATSHDDALCRESAAAALGAIGDPRGLDAVLAACDDRVTVRRRATLALAAFDDPRADEALHRALDDKDWQVRQAAEDLLEVGRSLDGDPDPDAYAD